MVSFQATDLADVLQIAHRNFVGKVEGNMFIWTFLGGMRYGVISASKVT